MINPWNTRTLFESLSASDFGSVSGAKLELLEGIDPAINVVLPGYGDLEVQLAVAGNQIFVSTPLCSANQVKDRAAFNEACLRLNLLNPLSNLGLQTNNGQDIYVVFGELSSYASLDNVREEILVLADNTLEAAQAFSDYLKENNP